MRTPSDEEAAKMWKPDIVAPVSVGKVPAPVIPVTPPEILPPDTDILELCKSNLPTMLKKAIDAALVSEDVREIMPVLTTLVDRVHGKVGVGEKSGGANGGQLEVVIRFIDAGGEVPSDGI